MEKSFSLEGRPYVELKNLIKLLQLTNSGGETKHLLAEGIVSVNGEVEMRRGKKLRAGDKVCIYDDVYLIEQD